VGSERTALVPGVRNQSVCVVITEAEGWTLFFILAREMSNSSQRNLSLLQALLAGEGLPAVLLA
jgi:hypothetical protein